MALLESHEEEILSRRPTGRDCTPLAIEYGVCYVTMWKFLKKNGVSFQRNTLTKEQEANLLRDYAAGELPEALGKKYGICMASALNYVHRNNAELHPRYRKSTINHNFFKTFTVESLWVLGWLFSDGNLSKSSNRFNISVHRKDEKVLTLIRDTMGVDTDSIYRPVDRNLSTFYGCDKTIYDDLVTLGCIPNKSLVVRYPTQLTQNWQHWAFLRGILEGDGYLAFKAKGNRPGFTFGIASGCQLFLEDIRAILKRCLNINAVVRYQAKREKSYSDSYNLQVLGGREPILRLLDLIYENGNAKHYLDRKFQTYLKMKEVAARPCDNRAINRARQTEVHLRSPEGIIYHVKGTRPFSREMGISDAMIRNMMKPRKFRLVRGGRGWSIATTDQIAAAKASATLIEKFY